MKDVEPVMEAAASEARWAASPATALGWPTRPSGTSDSNLATVDARPGVMY
jgi:hypothetical protein